MGDLLFDSARHTVAQSKIDAARITQASGNEKRGAVSSLEQFSQSLANSHRMDAAGADITASSENLARNLDAATYGKLEHRVGAAEDIGAFAAEVGAAGMGGSGVDAYNKTLELTASLQEEQGNRQVNSENIGQTRRQGATLINAVDGLDNSVVRADQDVTQFVDDHKMGTFQKAFTLAAAATATYFGGPQAGQAVLQISGAQQKANNGDFAGAASEFGQGLNSASAGFKVWHSGADDTHSGSAWGKEAFSSVKLK